MLLSFLKYSHTDDNGCLDINHSKAVLKFTADLIKDDAPTDYDCMVSELMESDESESLCQSMTSGEIDDQIKCLSDLDDKSDEILIETIQRLLEAG